MDRLDLVKLQINDQNSEFCTAVDVGVGVRGNDIAGAILRTSSTDNFANQINTISRTGFQAVELVRFDFGMSVVLRPGSAWFLQPFKTGGDSDLGLFGTGFGIDAYLRATAIFSFLLSPFPPFSPFSPFPPFRAATLTGANAPFDLWFRERATPRASEPPVSVLRGVGLLALVSRRRPHARRQPTSDQ